MRLIISGGSGFLGKSVIKQWLSDPQNDLIAITRSDKARDAIQQFLSEERNRLRFISNSERDLNSLKVKENSEAVILHLATLYRKNPSKTDLLLMKEANIDLGIYLAHVADILGVKFVYTSSYMEYMNEVAPEVMAYVAMKKQLGNQIRLFPRIRVIENVIADTYGPQDDRGKVLSQIIKAIKCGEPFQSTNPNHLISLTHSMDVAAGVINSFSFSGERALCASKKLVTIEKLAKYAYQISRKETPPDIVGEEIESDFRWLEFLHVPGWGPKIELYEGISELMYEAQIF